MQPAGPATPLSETLDNRQKWLLLGSLMTCLFVGALDQTVVSTATPKILADLGGFELISWLFTSYMLSSTVVIPLVGKLGDIFGRKLFLIGGVFVFMVSSAACGAATSMPMLSSTVVIPLVGKLGDIYGRKLFLIGGVFVFMVSSAACGAATSMPMLIWMRVVQGIGGGMIFASVFATMGDIFAPAERGKYIGLFTGMFSLASLLGPAVGGTLTDHLSWRWVFFVNVPVSLIAMPAIWFNLPSKVRHLQPKLDFLGAALLSASSVMVLLALVWAGDRYAWSSVEIAGLLGGAGVLLAGFIFQELRHPEPILPLHLFKNGVFLMSNLIVFTFGMGVFGAFQFLGIYMQTALGVSATESGIVSTPQSLGVLATSIIGGQLIARLGHYKWQTVFGTVLIALSLGALTQVSLHTSQLSIGATMFVLGLGFGLVLPTMSLVVQNAVSYQYIGVASSASQFFRQIGSVLGIAIFGSILANTYHDQFVERFSAEDRAAVGAAITQQLDDPTVRLNERQYAVIQSQVTALPGGAEILERAELAQGESVVQAVRYIFYGAVAAAIACLVCAILMKELPLRRTVAGPPPVQQPAGAAGATSEPAPGAVGR